MANYIRRFDEIGIADVPLVGGKNASLGEMVGALAKAGIAVPDGFATTARAYRDFIAHNGLAGEIESALAGLDAADTDALRRAGRTLRDKLRAGAFPDRLRNEILLAYEHLSRQYGMEATDVAVRSSATAEDLPEASFAGQQETFLNVAGGEALLEACRRCFASLFTDRAIFYRAQHGFDHMAVALSIGVQKMVRSDRGAAGVMFTLDTESGFRDVVLINAAYGLGENVVRGSVDPDEFYVFKPTLATGHRPILERRVGGKEMMLVYEGRGGTTGTRNVPVPPAQRRRLALTDDEVLTLARWGVAIEAHYSEHHGRPSPMDIEWAKDGDTGELCILQARPETVHSTGRGRAQVYRLEEGGEVLAEGQAVGGRIGAGPTHRIVDLKDAAAFREGEVLVTDMTDPDWVPIMKKAAAIVTEHGGRTCHAAIVSRELGLPAIVGAHDALQRLTDGRDVTVSCAEGQTGRVYAGRLAYRVDEVELASDRRPATPVMLIVADPGRAFEFAQLPNDGVGLARMEFIINNAIGIHPMALIHPERTNASARRAIAERTGGDGDGPAFFVDRLAEGIGRIAAAFHPKPVILRTSDFKSNEYARLLGGEAFEAPEANPMLGFRGAARYADERYREAFALECAAIRRVRQDMGLTNLKVMIPFCRTLAEADAVLELLAAHGLRRGEAGLEVWVMCELPSNVLLADRFAERFDGFSIGSNDLTQLTLGVDRDSDLLQASFDERDEAVRRMLRLAIEGAHAAGRPIGICGQAPSDYPEIADELVELGIDSISLNPDTVVQTTRRLLEREAEDGAS